MPRGSRIEASGSANHGGGPSTEGSGPFVDGSGGRKLALFPVPLRLCGSPGLSLRSLWSNSRFPASHGRPSVSLNVPSGTLPQIMTSLEQ